jgi:UDP-GlcNAc:undecaprenyl-phosphate GlcNAc-1-phosphate transferase
MYTLVATVWFAGICHAMNLLDNMDGLAAGVGLIAALFLAALLGEYVGPALVTMLVALAGALLGFLYWNRNRARLFMGDCGSLFIGGLLAAASLVPISNAPLAFINPAVIVILILIVPLFDTGFVLVLRRLAGQKATKGAPTMSPTGSCRSDSRNAARSGFCICSDSLAAAQHGS